MMDNSFEQSLRDMLKAPEGQVHDDVSLNKVLKKLIDSWVLALFLGYLGER